MSPAGPPPTETSESHVQVLPVIPETAAAFCRLATSLGLDAVRIDLADCADKAAFLQRTARALEFPAWFGGNWDAFYDCLADLGWRPGAGHVLVFEHADAMRRNAPEALDTAISVLRDAAEAWRARDVTFRVFVDGPPAVGTDGCEAQRFG